MIDPPTPAAAPTGVRARGLEHPFHPTVIGSVIGSIGGTVFVLVNAGGLPAPWSTVAVVGWLVAMVLIIWSVFLRPRVLVSPAPPEPRAGVIYGLSVAAMVAGMFGGHAVLVALGQEQAQPALAVACVGAHFVPFAATFDAPVFRPMGWSMLTVGLIGLVASVSTAGGTAAAAAAAVIGGLTMVGWIIAAAVRS